MKDSCYARNRQIYRLWRQGLEPHQIATTPFCQPLSPRSIQNIVYQKQPPTTPRNKQLLQLFNEALDQGMTPKEAIEHTYLHQPPEYLSIRTIKHIINQQHNKK